jgi:gliding motility-associated-like protein
MNRDRKTLLETQLIIFTPTSFMSSHSNLDILNWIKLDNIKGASHILYTISLVVVLSSTICSLILSQNTLDIYDSIPVEKLVNDVLVSGACLNIQNVKVIGDGKGIGYYEYDGLLPLEKRGIILTTGILSEAIGPNLSSAKTSIRYREATDPDLDIVADEELYDATGIEFDFIPYDTVVKFRFQFASEEYCEFVGQEFNDVFGFFVSGPGITGPYSRNARNVAILPETNIPVSVNTVNHKTNKEYYISTPCSCDIESCDIDEIPLYLEILEFDGLTVSLTASFSVIPCEEYHIRMVISDVADAFWDSAVFLESKSFQLGGDVEVKAIVEGNDSSQVLEGCGDSYFLFERTDKKNNNELTFDAFVTASGSATPGKDFEEIVKTLTIPENQDHIIWPVKTLFDNEVESPEDIQIALNLSCECSSVQARLEILDNPSLQATINSESACEGTPTSLQSFVVGGQGPYSYLWSNGDTTNTAIMVFDTISTAFVSISDGCSQQITNSIEITPIESPTAQISGTTLLCDVLQPHFLPIELKGASPWQLMYSFDGSDSTFTIFSNSPTYNLPVFYQGAYNLISVSDSLCVGNVSGVGIVDKDPLELILKNCDQTQSSSFEYEFTGRGEALFSLNSGASFQPIHDLKNLETNKEYTILLKDGAGCTNWQTIFLPSQVGFEVTLPEDYTVKFNRPITLEPSINFPQNFIKEIKWFPEESLSCLNCMTPIATTLESTTFEIQILDKFNCIHTAQTKVNVDLITFFVPNVFSPHNSDGLNDRLIVYLDEQAVKNVIEFSIFDRWGNLVYNEENFNNNSQLGWKGTYNNQKIKPGVFAYSITVELLNGKIVHSSGDVTLLN